MYTNDVSFRMAIAKIASEEGLPLNWINSDFVNSASYSPFLLRVAMPYRSYGLLDLYVLDYPHQIAMKIKSSRPSGGDLDDVIRMIYELRDREIPCSMQDIRQAFDELYLHDDHDVFALFWEEAEKAMALPLEEIREILHPDIFKD